MTDEKDDNEKAYEAFRKERLAKDGGKDVAGNAGADDVGSDVHNGGSCIGWKACVIFSILFMTVFVMFAFLLWMQYDMSHMLEEIYAVC